MTSYGLSARILCAVGVAIDSMDETVEDVQFDGTLTVPVLHVDDDSDDSDDDTDPLVLSVYYSNGQHFAVVDL
jgi:hypothetical protein